MSKNAKKIKTNTNSNHIKKKENMDDDYFCVYCGLTQCICVECQICGDYTLNSDFCDECNEKIDKQTKYESDEQSVDSQPNWQIIYDKSVNNYYAIECVGLEGENVYLVGSGNQYDESILNANLGGLMDAPSSNDIAKFVKNYFANYRR